MRNILFHILLLFSINSVAQTSVYENELKIKGSYGSLLPHRAIMKHLHTGNTKAFEISYNFNTYGKKEFHSVFNYPQLGVVLGIYDLGNKEDIGLTYALTPTISIPFSDNKYLPQLKIGVGLGLVSKPFGFDGSYRNVAIGSYINAAILFELEKSVQISEKLKWFYSVSMLHYSNGASTLPNLGLNTFTFNTGVSFALGEKKDRLPEKDEKLDKLIHFNPFIYGGWRENSIHVPKKYGVGVISFEFLKRINRKGNLIFGVDAVYNSSVEHFDELNHLEENVDVLKKGSNFQNGIFVGYNILFGDISLVIQQGVYTYNQYKGRGLLYNRLAVRKQFGDNISASFGLKSHLAVAEYVEFGIGYKF